MDNKDKDYDRWGRHFTNDYYEVDPKELGGFYDKDTRIDLGYGAKCDCSYDGFFRCKFHRRN